MVALAKEEEKGAGKQTKAIAGFATMAKPTCYISPQTRREIDN